MEKYKWVPVDDHGSFVKGDKWNYMKGNKILARIVNFDDCRPGTEWKCGVHLSQFYKYKKNIRSAAKYVERKYK